MATVMRWISAARVMYRRAMLCTVPNEYDPYSVCRIRVKALDSYYGNGLVTLAFLAIPYLNKLPPIATLTHHRWDSQVNGVT